jgi:hypothetical protein
LAKGAVDLGEAPVAAQTEAAGLSTSRPIAPTALSVDVSDRAAVADFYYTTYMVSEGVDTGWTGSTASCDPGTISQAHKNAIILRVNYFRAMAGLPGAVTLNPEWDAKCQKAALMFVAQGALSHQPPPTWACYTADGADAASKSNNALGSYGPAAIDGFIEDAGAPNNLVGHRRWILYPPTELMGAGATTAQSPGFWPGSMALWILGGFGTRPSTPNGVSWPPQGHVPYQLVYARWSFSYPNADFSSTAVEMNRDGSAVSLTLEPVATGYGDNTIVWEPQGVPSSAPAQDISYDVTVRNVGVGGTPRDFSYTVTIIDPAVTVPTPPATPTPVGTPTPRPTPTPAPTANPGPIRDLIASFYDLVLGRPPEAGAVDAWESGYFQYALSFGIDVRFIPREMARLFFLSQEYANRSRTDSEFITDCYQVFLNRAPTQTELSNWTSGAWNRSQVMTVFSESEEFANRIESLYSGLGGVETRNFVTTMYIGLLDRLVDQSGLEYASDLFAAAYAQGGVETVRAQAIQMGREVIVSAEFLGKQPATGDYVTRFYRAYLGRFPGDNEVAYWSGELGAGRQTYDSVINLFANSQEFTTRLNQFFH